MIPAIDTAVSPPRSLSGMLVLGRPHAGASTGAVTAVAGPNRSAPPLPAPSQVRNQDKSVLAPLQPMIDPRSQPSRKPGAEPVH